MLVISLLAGVAFSPSGAGFIRPLDYADGSAENVQAITLYFSRLVLGVQLVLAGVQLPSRYLQKQWKPLSILLGPIMAVMWLAASLVVWGLVPNLPFLHALVIGSCVAPTDPVLSNVIVKGRFADHNVPKELQRIIVAESGANDGLGYPFLFFALYLIKYTQGGADSPDSEGGARMAMALWFGETWGYTILLSVVYGAVVGWVAKELLHWAEERNYVDRESFLVFAISLALFIVGTCGMIGSDDILACFIAGNVFTWDDWFRLETMDDSLQPTVDMLLNVSVFMWYGAVCPWTSFLQNSVVHIGRLVALGVLILLLRRLPWVWLVHAYGGLIPQIEGKRQAVFVGFFGPVGVSAVFYLYITLEFLKTLTLDNGDMRPDVAHLPETVDVVVWFIAICSIVSFNLPLLSRHADCFAANEASVITVAYQLREQTSRCCLRCRRSLYCHCWNFARLTVTQVVHGLSIPLGKLGFYLPRTLSIGVSSPPPGRGPFRLGSRVTTLIRGAGAQNAVSPGAPQPPANPQTPHRTALADLSSSTALARDVFRIGGSVISPRQENELIIDSKRRAATPDYLTCTAGNSSSSMAVERSAKDANAQDLTEPPSQIPDQDAGNPRISTGMSPRSSGLQALGRSIRFPDEEGPQVRAREGA